MTDETTEYRTIPHTDVTPGLHARLRGGRGLPWGPYYAIYTERGWYDLSDGEPISTGETTIVEVPVPAPSPAVTDEQRAAVEWLQTVSARGKLIVADSSLDAYADTILALLSSELTNPQPELPTEPGWYTCDEPGAYSGQPWELRADGTWWVSQGQHHDAQRFAPFTRLVPERPQITREQIRATVGPLVTNVMNYPEEVRSHMLSRDFSGLIYMVTDALDALVNGADK